MEKFGELIVSTKGALVARKTYTCICSAFFYLMALFCIINIEAFDGLEGMIFFFLTLAAPTFMLYSTFKGGRSYCDVYEHGVVGTTSIKGQLAFSDTQNFELSYEDILNVTTSSNSLTIYTSQGTFQVLATKNRDLAANAIRDRMRGGK